MVILFLEILCRLRCCDKYCVLARACNTNERKCCTHAFTVLATRWEYQDVAYYAVEECLLLQCASQIELCLMCLLDFIWQLQVIFLVLHDARFSLVHPPFPDFAEKSLFRCTKNTNDGVIKKAIPISTRLICFQSQPKFDLGLI